MTILFIDDDQDDVDIFCEAVREVDANITCMIASNGQEGLDVLRNVLPDFVFLDVNMPVLDGKDTLRKIRGTFEFGGLPVCILSTTISPSDAELYAKLGATYCIVKPNTFQLLCDALKSIFVPATGHFSAAGTGRA